ncbi:uncharacterized protein LOC127859870 [Dreissena polymorpha]|uniref:Uncharacterized protein n=1 Tax=Dreissena polymorpha TaxID=45954 RepID=A0A9D3YEJ9_DREPO|nr:uncharacterized protein LOC127859870 [Dreissena polymorpha]XP_052253405.1 uncharacterized protein LOC127859870 [Dreissena polymorpha]KAH3699262.1 hypothetical protein DPMN_074218 [Dreissena polymorpha]
MDNPGFMSINLGMNLVSSQPSNSGQLIQQLPGIQQIFTHTASAKPVEGLQNVIQQAILPANGQSGVGTPSLLAGNQSMMPPGLQIIGQPNQSAFLAQQQLMTEQAAQNLNMGGRGLVPSNYQFMPRGNFTLVNQPVQGTSVAVQLSPQQLGTNLGATTLSPIEHQQLLQAATFDTQLAALQNQQAQQVAFHNAAGQLMLGSPQQQLMLQSPNQQFTLQSPSHHFTLQNQGQFTQQGQGVTQFTHQGQGLAQFTPQHHILTQGHNNNLIVHGQIQGQNTGLIVQGDNFSQGLFVQNPVFHNINQQMFASPPSVFNGNHLQGIFSHTPNIMNQNLGIMSLNQSPTGLKGLENHADKMDAMSPNTGLMNQQMQLLAQIAHNSNPGSFQQPGIMTNVLKQQPQTINIVSQPGSLPANSMTQNPSLPSFGHFLLHHHMQSLPHPFLQNLTITTASTANNPLKFEVHPSQGQMVSPVDVSSINAQFNNWNKGQVHGRTKKQSGQGSATPKLASSLPFLTPKTVALTPVTVSPATSACTPPPLVTVSVTMTTCTVDIVASKAKTSGDSSSYSALLKTVSQPIELQKDCHGVSDRAQSLISVPSGWTRKVEEDSVVYYSPTCERLTSSETLKQYLGSEGTCKCGLECPILVEKVFNFSTSVVTVTWNPLPAELATVRRGSCQHRGVSESRATSAAEMPVSVAVSASTDLSVSSLRPEVCVVPSSTMMSPRVSSTVQESMQTGIQPCRCKKSIQTNEEYDLSASPDSLTVQYQKDITTQSATVCEHVAGCASEQEDGRNIPHAPEGIQMESACEPIQPELWISNCGDIAGAVAGNRSELIGNLVECDTLCESSSNKDVLHEKSGTKVQHLANLAAGEVVDSVHTANKSGSRSVNQTVQTSSMNMSKDKGARKLSGKCEPITKSYSALVACLNTPVKCESLVKKINKKSVHNSPSVKNSIHSIVRSNENRRQNSRSAVNLEGSMGVVSSSETALVDAKVLSPVVDVFTSEMLAHLIQDGERDSSLVSSIVSDYGPAIVQADHTNSYSATESVQTIYPDLSSISQSGIKQNMLSPNVLKSFQTNLLANLHNLSSPPNQQVFPATDVSQGCVLPKGYQHGSLKKTVSDNQGAINNPENSLCELIIPHSICCTTAEEVANLAMLREQLKLYRSAKASDKQKLDNIFDSDVPPPNVDVSQLKDKGHGPIPKEKIATSENLSRNVISVSNLATTSLKCSMSSSQNLDNEHYCDEASDSFEATRLLDVTRSDSACSDRLPVESPNVLLMDSESNNSDLSTKSLIASIASVPLTPIDAYRAIPASVKIKVHKEEHFSLPIASAPPTPTTVVHHTPGSLSCHQMSLNKARQHVHTHQTSPAVSSSVDNISNVSRVDLINDTSILSPLAAILSNPTICQAFKQMFPEVMHEAVLQSLGSITPSSGQTLPAKESVVHSTELNSFEAFTSTQCSTAQQQPDIKTGRSPQPHSRPGFPMTQARLHAPEYPASTLLTAAAKNQFFQQQNALRIILNQQAQAVANGHSFKLQVPGSAVSVNSPRSVAPVVNLVPHNPVVSNIEKNPKPKGSSTISELLNNSIVSSQASLQNTVQNVDKPSGVLGQTQLNPGFQLQINQPCTTQLGKPHNTGIPVFSFPGTLCVQPQKSLGGMNVQLPSVGNQRNETANMNLGNLNSQMLQLHSALGLPIQLANQHLIQHDSGVGNILQLQNICPNFDKNMLQNLPLLLQQQRQQQQFPNLSNNVNINMSIPLLGMHGVHPGMISIPSSQSHLNEQVNSNNIHSSVPQMILTSQGIGPGNYAPNNSSVSANLSNLSQCVGNQSLPMMPVPINVQQTYSATGTQLTAMQLQTLQLQQQLLNQLQQVQGMQNLINQFNMQGLASDKHAGVLSEANAATFVSNTLTDGASETSSLCNAPVSCNSSIPTNATSQFCSRVSASVSSQCVISSTNELQTTKSVRVIAAADTTADCNETTETVDIGTETEEVDQNQDKDNEAEDEDEKSGSEESHFRGRGCGKDDQDDESIHKSDDRSDLNDSREDMELSDDKELEDISSVAHSEGFTDLKEYYKPPAMQSTLSSSQVDCISPTPSVNSISTTSKAAATCLAIATWKGNSRSRKQRSSLANSQNLAAELSTPSKGELKLKIKKKHLLSSTIKEVFSKRQKKRTKGATTKALFEKKELRSSTQAATKASSMLAACSGDTKANKTGKEDSSVSGGNIFDKNNDYFVESIQTQNVHMKSHSETMNTEELECDSSSNALENLDISIAHKDEEITEKHQVELTSRIAAALSCQKGRWLLSSARNKTDPRGELSSGAADPSVLHGLKGSKRSRESNELDQNNDEGVKSGPASSYVHSFSTGDLVWGQIRGFPSWPGKLVETDTKQGLVADEGKLLVKWFGDNTVTRVEPDKLKTLSEGLEAHHRARKKHRRGRKMNSNLEQAIQQAMAELDRQTNEHTSDSPLQTLGQ